MRIKAKTFRQPGSVEAGKMNKTETEYAKYLELKKLSEEIKHFMFEPIGLRLANRTTYNPDFLVVNKHDQIEVHEVKGFWRDDARVKIKVASKQFDFFRFVAVTKRRVSKGEPQWKLEEF